MEKQWYENIRKPNFFYFKIKCFVNFGILGSSGSSYRNRDNRWHGNDARNWGHNDRKHGMN